MNHDSSTSAGNSTFGVIDLLHDTQVAFWCQIFDVSPTELREAVQHAGHNAPDVARYLRDKKRAA